MRYVYTVTQIRTWCGDTLFSVDVYYKSVAPENKAVVGQSIFHTRDAAEAYGKWCTGE